MNSGMCRDGRILRLVGILWLLIVIVIVIVFFPIVLIVSFLFILLLLLGFFLAVSKLLMTGQDPSTPFFLLQIQPFIKFTHPSQIICTDWIDSKLSIRLSIFTFMSKWMDRVLVERVEVGCVHLLKHHKSYTTVDCGKMGLLVYNSP